MSSICQLTASLTYHLYMEYVDMRKSFQGLQGLINASFGRYLSSDDAFSFLSKNRRTLKIVRYENHKVILYDISYERGYSFICRLTEKLFA